MRISIIGASKGTGLAAVKRAVERGHTVKTLSRTNLSLELRPSINSIIGDATRKEDLSEAIADAEGVLIMLGKSKNLGKTTLMEESIKTLLAIHNEHPIRVPVIILSGFGAGESLKYSGFFPKLVFRTLLKKVYDDKRKMENIIKESSILWEVVRPGMLHDEALTEKYRIETELFKGINIKKISRADVADYMIKEIEKPQNLRKFVSLTCD